jgi:hypothetical protein
MIEAMARSDASTLDGEAALASAARGERVTAVRRIAATVDDLIRLAVLSLVTGLVAFAYLFWRTSWGALDGGAVDTAIAAALLLAPPAAWTAWVLAAALEGATPGQARRGLLVRREATARRGALLLRFALSPLAAPGWLWLGAVWYLLAVPVFAALFALAAGVAALFGLVSLVLLAAGRRPLHDAIARTTVVETEGRP